MTTTARLGSWSRPANSTLIARGLIGGWQTKGPVRRFCASDLGLCCVERVTRIELALPVWKIGGSAPHPGTYSGLRCPC